MKRAAPLLFLACLASLSLLAVPAVLYAVPGQAGGTWDSMVYLGTARNLATGLGFYMAHILPSAPYTHWTPLYPMILALPARFGIDPADSAKWINAASLTCTTFLTGLIAWTYCGRSYIAGLLTAAAVLLSADMILIHAEAMSEPLFMAFFLASILAVQSYAESGKTRAIILAAFAMAAALLTRYAGISIPIGACLIIALNWRALTQRPVPWIGLVLAAAIIVLPTAIWIAHNVQVKGGTVGERKLVFHPVSLVQVRNLFNTFSLWLAPRAVPSSLRLALLVGIVAAMAATLVAAARASGSAAAAHFRSAWALAGAV